MSTKRTVEMRHPTRGTVEIPLGFSWPALVLGPLWALVKRLWMVFLLLVLGLVAITIVQLYAETSLNVTLILISLALSAVYMYACGKYGNAWWRWTLEQRGYQVAASEKES